MLCSKLQPIVGTMWILRNQEKSQLTNQLHKCSEKERCPICGESWVLPDQEENSYTESSVLVVLAEPVADEAQQILLKNCLKAAGWSNRYACFSLHLPCTRSHQTAVLALREHLASYAPELIIVFGMTAAQILDPTFVSGQLHQFDRARLIATHHPAEMIANPILKAQVWSDICLSKIE